VRNEARAGWTPHNSSFHRTRAISQHTPSPRQPENTITLTEGFYDEVNQHPIPVEKHVVASLANAPGLLDFYVWIVWKSWTSKTSHAQIPPFGPQRLQGKLGAVKYSRNKRFRQTLRRWLARIRLLWPECPAEPSQDGQYLIVRSSNQAPGIRREPAKSAMHMSWEIRELLSLTSRISGTPSQPR